MMMILYGLGLPLSDWASGWVFLSMLSSFFHLSYRVSSSTPLVHHFHYVARCTFQELLLSVEVVSFIILLEVISQLKTVLSHSLFQCICWGFFFIENIASFRALLFHFVILFLIYYSSSSASNFVCLYSFVCLIPLEKVNFKK